MPQALPAPSAALSPVTVCTGPQPAETANSGQSFSDALSNELGTGDAPAATVTKDPAPAEATATGPDKAPDTATVAAGGNSLPPALPPDAILTLSMLMPGAAPNPDVATLPASTSEHDTLPRSESPAPVSGDVAPAVMPAAALPVATFSLPEAGRADSPASDATTAMASATATAAKPAVPAPHVAGLINTRDLPTVGAGVNVDVDPPAVTTKAGAELVKAAVENVKATATTVRAEPVVDLPALVIPNHASAETLPMLANSTSSAAGSALPGATVSVPFGQPTWGQALGNQVVWAVNQGLPAAALHLSPPELGPVSVHIRLDQDQASIVFSSPHVAVRDAIEAAMPRLRDMLGDQGIALVNVNVSQHGSSHTPAQAQDYNPGSGRTAVESPEDGGVLGGPVRQVILGVLDLYA